MTTDSVINLCMEDQKALAAALLDGKPHPDPRKFARLRRAIRDHSRCVESEPGKNERTNTR